MIERIEISVIPQDLRHEETIVQIAEALDNLDFAVSHIFNSINERISLHTKRLGVIRTRATKLQEQLEYLQNNLNLKAIKLYSAAKYPANHTYNEYTLVIQPKSRVEIPDNKIYRSSVPISDKSDSVLTSNSKMENKQYTSNLNLQEKLQFYYVKSKPYKKTKTYIKKDHAKENISSIDSLLLFNVKDSQTSVNLELAQNEKKNQIQDAPNSILQPWHTSEIEYPSSYLYAPTLGEVPQMNVPLMLPHLPGIVDDERFSLDLNSQSPIAPSSMAATPTIRHDPSISEISEQYNKKSEASNKVFSNVNIRSNTSLSLAYVAKSVSEQLLEETPLKASSNVPVVTSQSQTVVSPSTPPPPPPPPPPLSPPPSLPPLPPSLPLEYKEELKSIKIIKNSTVLNANATDDRSNLMAAIRDAGGLGRAKLKHAVLADKTKDRWSSASVGGDLMADLHATLSLRRKGIAGSAINALVRMSSMIPPPPKPNESSTSDRNSATSECESQDDDGWEE